MPVMKRQSSRADKASPSRRMRGNRAGGRNRAGGGCEGIGLEEEIGPEENARESSGFIRVVELQVREERNVITIRWCSKSEIGVLLERRLVSSKEIILVANKKWSAVLPDPVVQVLPDPVVQVISGSS